MKIYEGNKPCPGCGRTGAEYARITKDGLCCDCQKMLEIGRALSKEKALERNYYRLDDLVIAEMTWYTIRTAEVSKKVINLLRTFSAFDSQYASRLSPRESLLAGRIDGTTSRDEVILPRITFEAAKELCRTLEDECHKLEAEKREYRGKLDAELAEQKNDIFNKGVERGRDLLFQLNSGQITSADFYKTIKEY